MKFTRFFTMPMGIEDGGVHTLISHSIQATLSSTLPTTFRKTNDKNVEIISLIFKNKPLRVVLYFYHTTLSFLNEQLFV